MTIDQLPQLSDISGEVYVPCTKAGADYKTPLAPLCVNVPANGTINFSATNGTRFLLFTASNNDEAKTLFIVNVSNVGAVSYYAVKSGTAINITTGTNSFAVTSANTGAIGILVFAGSVTQA